MQRVRKREQQCIGLFRVKRKPPWYAAEQESLMKFEGRTPSAKMAVKSLHWRWHFQDTAVQIKTFWRSVFVQNTCLVAGGPNYNDSPTKPEIKDKKISLSVSCHWIWRWHMQTVGTTFASCNTYRSYPTAIMFVIARSMSFKLVLHPLPHTKTFSTISRLACTCSSDSVKCVRISERWRHNFYDDTTLKDEHFF